MNSGIQIIRILVVEWQVIHLVSLMQYCYSSNFSCAEAFFPTTAVLATNCIMIAYAVEAIKEGNGELKPSVAPKQRTD